MELCSRCHKRLPVVFISKFVNNQMVNEGLCIKCARELGIKQVEDVIKQMNISDEEIERMNAEIDDPSDLPDIAEGGDDEGKAPPIDIRKLFGNALGENGFPIRPMQGGDGNSAGQGAKKAGTKAQKRKFLDAYCKNLTNDAREGKLDRVIGREREMARLMQILCRRQKNNPCLIGEPGVGKTAVAEALAQKIVSGDVPFKLRDKEIQLVDMTAIVAGTQFRGQFETRMKGLIDEVKALGNIILVIDEVHTIASAGDAEGSMNAANILKPALSRGEIQVIGATTLSEYRKYIEKDAALERRFQPIIIEEPSVEDSIKILSGLKSYYEKFHGIKIPEETVSRAVTLSERYITDRFLPDKAIDLLDEASSYLALNSPVIEKYDELSSDLKKITSEREALEAETTDETDQQKLDERYHRLADLKSSELVKQTELDKLKSEREDVALSIADLAHVIEIWTGIPASNITENEFEKIDRLESNIKSRIMGQDKAAKAVAMAIKRSRAGVAYKRKPVSFIFAGPTGVGKTELVKTLARELFDSPETMIRLDMSEFMEKFSVSRIIGAPPGYVGYDEAGQLTEKIRRKPYSVILFDEIEKAHPDVLNILLQILDDGRLTDAQGRVVNFENAVIIMTTNAGSDIGTNTAGFGFSTESRSEDRVMKALSGFLRPEFINRVDEIVVFNQLTENDFVKIADLMLDDLKNALSDKGIAFKYTEKAAEFVAKHSYSRQYGARNMRRYIQREIEGELANRIIGSYSHGISAISLDADDEKLLFDSI